MCSINCFSPGKYRLIFAHKIHHFLVRTTFFLFLIPTCEGQLPHFLLTKTRFLIFLIVVLPFQVHTFPSKLRFSTDFRRRPVHSDWRISKLTKQFLINERKYTPYEWVSLFVFLSLFAKEKFHLQSLTDGYKAISGINLYYLLLT